MKQHNLMERKLAQKADVAQSTINSLFRKNNLSAMSTLESLLTAIDMTLSGFLCDESPVKEYKLEEQDLLRKWGLLTNKQRKPILQLIDLLLDNGSKN